MTPPDPPTLIATETQMDRSPQQIMHSALCFYRDGLIRQNGEFPTGGTVCQRVNWLQRAISAHEADCLIAGGPYLTNANASTTFREVLARLSPLADVEEATATADADACSHADFCAAAY